MNHKPIIGIVSKPNLFCDNDNFAQQVIYDGVRNAILKNNGIAIGILPTKISTKFCASDDIIDGTYFSDSELQDLYSVIDQCDGLILQGGLSSDDYEIKAAKYAIDHDIPLLGICAGFNNIIRAMGGKVFCMNDTIHNTEDGSIVHKNIIEENTLLYDLLKTNKIGVNSIHTMFANKEDIKDLNISAYSDDGYVEAVELKDKKFCLGVKWHPELMLDNEKMNHIFETFIETCKK
jgi:putative glutamine amidotransferase